MNDCLRRPKHCVTAIATINSSHHMWMCSSVYIWRSRKGVQWVCSTLPAVHPRSAHWKHQCRDSGDAKCISHTDGLSFDVHKWRERGHIEGEAEDYLTVLWGGGLCFFVCVVHTGSLREFEFHFSVCAKHILGLTIKLTWTLTILVFPRWYSSSGFICISKALTTLSSISLDRCYTQVTNLKDKLEDLKQRFGLSSTQKLVHSAHLEMEQVRMCTGV